jgi:hypothetical protein
MRCMSGWLNSSMKVDDHIYLKGMFQLEASSWLIDHLNGCWHDAHNQSKDNSQKNPGDKILHDESSNTTLGGMVKLDKQWKQQSSLKAQDRHCIYNWGIASTWMSQCIERTKKASECKQRHPMTMDIKEWGTYISNQVRMHAYHLT